MKTTKSTATARISVTVQLDVGSTWGPECTVGQVHDQASREGVELLRRLLEGKALIVGEPKVSAVLLERT